MAATMHDLLTLMIERGASDLHITTGTHPQIRLHGKLTALTQFDVQMPQDTQRLAYSVLNEGQKQKFEEENELDLSFGIQGLARFRCNVYRQRGAVAAAIRVIPVKIRGVRRAGPARDRGADGGSPQGPDPGHRPHRLRQVDHAGRDGRQGQLGARRAHRHHRGPDRVRPPAQEVHGEPARGRARTPTRSRTRSSRSCGRTPTWCSSARCATSRPSRPRSPSRRPAT